MRIIAGALGGRNLKTVEGPGYRPATAKVREAIFSMLSSRGVVWSGLRVLDLFAGSGGIGIEALSRGAGFAVFVEQNPKAAEIIRENLKATKLEEQALVMNCDALSALKRLEGKYRFDYIFMDPPYNQELERQALSCLKTSALIDKQSTIIIEASLETSFDYLESMGFLMEKNKQYKTNRHVFVYRGE